MHDIKDIRQNPDRFRKALQDRGQSPEAIDQALAVDEELRAVKTQAQELQSQHNRATRLVAVRKQIEQKESEIAEIDAALASLDAKLASLDQQCLDSLAPFAGVLEEICKEISNKVIIRRGYL